MPTFSGTWAQMFKAGPPTTRRSSLSSSIKPYTPNSPTKETRHKRSKSVTFSGVDMVFELDLPTVANRSCSHSTNRDESPSPPRKKHLSMPLVPPLSNKAATQSPSFTQHPQTSHRIRQEEARIRASQSRERHRQSKRRNFELDDGAYRESRSRHRRITRGRSVDPRARTTVSQTRSRDGFEGPSPRDLKLLPLDKSPSASSKLELERALPKLATPHTPPALSAAAAAVGYHRRTHSNMDVSSNYTQLRASGHIAWSTSAPSLRTFYPAQPRTYIVRSLDLSQSGCVAMLDAGIDRLMPSRFNLLPTFKPSNITLQTSPGKGLGLFSPNMVYPGEALFAEHPILVLPYAVDAGVPLREAYDDMLSRLPAQTRQELLYFCQSTGAHEPTSAQHLISRITPFAIPLSVPNRDSSDVEMHRGVFLKMSRCNHSCGPNAVWRWDPESFSLILTAIRYINPGEEITIAYTNVSLPQHERRFNLRRSFGFRCACEWCTLDHKSVLESDAARFFLSTFWDSPSRPSFKAWCQESFYSSDTLILDHQRALRYIQREGLETLSSALPSTGIHMSDTIRHIDAISMCYAALEDIDKFAIWTRRAAEEREAFNVLGPDRKLVFSKWLSNPSCCPVWGAKKSTYLRG